MEQLELGQTPSQQNSVTVLSSDEHCHLTLYGSVELESPLHCGLEPKVNEQTPYIETVICN